MDLRTVKHFIWKQGGDLTLQYRPVPAKWKHDSMPVSTSSEQKQRWFPCICRQLLLEFSKLSVSTPRLRATQCPCQLHLKRRRKDCLVVVVRSCWSFADSVSAKWKRDSMPVSRSHDDSSVVVVSALVGVLHAVSTPNEIIACQLHLNRSNDSPVVAGVLQALSLPTPIESMTRCPFQLHLDRRWPLCNCRQILLEFRKLSPHRQDLSLNFSVNVMFVYDLVLQQNGVILLLWNILDYNSSRNVISLDLPRLPAL